MTVTNELLEAAVIGYETRKAVIERQILELKQIVNGGSPDVPVPERVRPVRKRSLAVRRRMAKAQRLRWAKLKAAG